MRLSDPARKLRVLNWSLHGVGALVACAIALVAETAGFRPLDAEVAACARRTAELRAAIGDGEGLRAEHAQFRRELAAARVQSAKLIERIPDQPQEADFLAQLSELAENAGLKIRDYRPGVIRPYASYATMEVNLVCAGEYESLCTFLDGLSALPRHCTVIGLEIDSACEAACHSMELSLELYVAAAEEPEAERR